MADQNFTEQSKTLDAARKLLKKKKKAVIIRPTGFGKTWMLTELIKDYKKVLYLYPSAVIRDTVVNRYYDCMYDSDACEYIDDDGEILDPETVTTYIEMNHIENCDLMTYAKLIRLNDEDFEAMDYDLVIFDECHRIGGAKTKLAVEKLFSYLSKTNTHFIGATATPTRMDTFDVVSYFFADNMVYTYTLFDAISNGIVPKPHYCYATYDFTTDLRDAAINLGEDPDDPNVKSIIDSQVIELAKIYNMPAILKEICDKYAVSTSYMKFIVFFCNKKHMTEKIHDVETWFREAYPHHTISTLRISSRNSIESKNVSRLNELVPQMNHIDLIACVDMLNMGYHVNDQTGIIMYRGTKSSTIYTQQLGRALSVGMNNSAIVFDIVDNLHRKAVFKMDGKSRRSYKRLRRNDKHASIMTKTYYTVAEDGKTLVFEDINGKITESQYHINDAGNIVDRNDVESCLIYDEKTNTVWYTYEENDPRKDINALTENCLHAVGHEAEYRELIAKAMAEPLTQKCKYAVELHFRSWCYNHNIEYPITNRMMKKLYDLDKNNFYEDFCKLLRDNKIDYPFNDVNALLAMGTDDDDVPLAICAKARNVSIDQILEYLGLNDE